MAPCFQTLRPAFLPFAFLLLLFPIVASENPDNEFQDPDNGLDYLHDRCFAFFFHLYRPFGSRYCCSFEIPGRGTSLRSLYKEGYEG